MPQSTRFSPIHGLLPTRPLSVFALHTDSNDGHRYVHQLYEKGVRNFVVEHIPEGVPTGDANFIVVKIP